MTERVDTLNRLLETQTDGLVNFNDIVKAVVTSTLSGIPTMLHIRGGLEDIKTNIVNLSNGDEKKVVREQGTTYLVDPRLAVAFIKQHCPDISQDVTRWEHVYGRADIPEQLANTYVLRQHLMSVFDNSKFRCTFQDGKWYFCLHDVVKAATNDSRTIDYLNKAYQNDELLREQVGSRTHYFFGYVTSVRISKHVTYISDRSNDQIVYTARVKYKLLT